MTATRQTGAAEVIHWMLHDGRFNTHMREFGSEMCRRIVAAGIPIARAFCYVGTLHPQVGAAAYIWKRGEEGATRVLGPRGIQDSLEFANSPLTVARGTKKVLRRRLIDPACPVDFKMLEQLRAEGGTDYVVVPMVCSDGEVNAITFLTDHPEGYSDAQVAGLEQVAEALGIVVELQSSRRIAKVLMDTYLGPRTGARVLSGTIARGSGESIRAVIWLCDLRGFTVLADRLPQGELSTMLNEYFGIMVKAVTDEGGEVLKFVGDGMLAIFELCQGEDVGPCCAAALRAARAAFKAADTVNAQRGIAERIRFGVALHLGEVYYGNIGSPERLDFTVIGPAVNHAARLERLASELGRGLVTSASFAAAAKEPLESLGRYNLRGVAEPQEVFAPGAKALDAESVSAPRS
jgi:adenylate cyclase